MNIKPQKSWLLIGWKEVGIVQSLPLFACDKMTGQLSFDFGNIDHVNLNVTYDVTAWLMLLPCGICQTC